MKQIFENWNRFCQKERSADRSKLLRERHSFVFEQIIKEISDDKLADVRRWMAKAGPHDYSFDDLFGGKMRLAFPLDTEDSRNLKTVITAIRKEGYKIPSDDEEAWQPGMPTPDDPGRFNRRQVMQKLRRLGSGEEYEVEITVADIEFQKTYDFTIPAGPRQGETIQKKDKRNMAKLMQKLAKEKKLDPDLLSWWQRRQTYYTKDRNYEEIEDLMSQGYIEDLQNYMIIVSRHPIDVLRMSDIGQIESCHSPKKSYFKCAQAEAKGHGPIAYLVRMRDYKELLAGMYSEYDTADDPEAAFDVSEKFAKEKAEEFIRKYAIRHAKFYSSLVKMLDNRELFEFGVDVIKDHPRVKRNFNDLPSTAKDQLTYQAFHDAVSAARKGQEWSLLTGDEHEPEDIKDMADFDTQEIFRDSDRNIRGIIARARVRLRKFYDQSTDETFAVPELKTFGAHPAGFVEAVRKWSWNEQKYIFIDEGPPEDEWEISFPRRQDIIRYGGSYEDTKDGQLFDLFFKEADEDILERSNYEGYDYGNFRHDTSDEGPSIFNRWIARVEELNDYASNNLEHFQVRASVEDYDIETPVIMAGATLELKVETNWDKGWDLINFASGKHPYPGHYSRSEASDEGDEYYSIPEYEASAQRIGNAHSDQVAALSKAILSNVKKYLHAEGSPSVDSWDIKTYFPSVGDARARLIVSLSVDYEPQQNHPDSYEQFIDELKSCEGSFEAMYEKIRRQLVGGLYLAPSPWDDTKEEVTELEDELNNFVVVGEDEDDPDGEALFTLMGRSMGDSPDFIISTGIDFPINRYPRKIDVEDFTKNVFIPNVLGGGTIVRAATLLIPSGEFSGESVHHAREEINIDGSQFKNEFLKHVKQLEEEANGYARNQLELSFGDKYKKPVFKGVNFAEDTKITVRLVGPRVWTQETGGNFTMNPILHYTFRIYARQSHSREQLSGTFKFVRFVDKNTDMIHRAMKLTAMKMFESAISTIETEHDEKFSQDAAVKLIMDLQTDPSVRQDPGLHAVLDFVYQNWGSMDKMERITAIEYLKKMQSGAEGVIYDGEGVHTRALTGDQGIFENIPGYPYNWIWEVTKTKRYYGSSWSVAKGSPFRYEPKLKPVSRESMGLPAAEEQLEKDAEAIASTFESRDRLIKRLIRERIRRKLENMLK